MTAVAPPPATNRLANLYYPQEMRDAEPQWERDAAREPDEADLAWRARAGDPAAFGELVRRHQASIYNVCYRMLGERSAAEDLAQEACIRAFERLDRFDASRPFGPWIRRVAANLCLNHLEQRAPPSQALDDETPDGAAQDPAAAMEQAETAASLRAALLALPPRYRAAVELRHFQGLSYAEMAATMGRPLSDVKSDLFRARRLLAQRLKHEA